MLFLTVYFQDFLPMDREMSDFISIYIFSFVMTIDDTRAICTLSKSEWVGGIAVKLPFVLLFGSQNNALLFV